MTWTIVIPRRTHQKSVNSYAIKCLAAIILHGLVEITKKEAKQTCAAWKKNSLRPEFLRMVLFPDQSIARVRCYHFKGNIEHINVYIYTYIDFPEM